MITIERYHDISCGHRVFGHESKCAHLHGHNYRVTFTCHAAKLDPLGRVLDFSEISKRLCNWLEENWDHRFLIWDQDTDAKRLQLMDPEGIVQVFFNPTAENMAQHLLFDIAPMLLQDTNVKAIKIRVEETRKCSATATTSIA